MKKIVLFSFLFAVFCLPSFAHAQSGLTIQQNTTSRKILILLVKSIDHVTGDTGDTLTITLSKNGGAFAAPAGAVTEIAYGWYALSPTTVDTNTLGSLVIHVTSTNGDPADIVGNIAAVNQDDALVFGLTGIGTLAGQSAITSKTNLIATNAMDSPNEITAQGLVTAVKADTGGLVTSVAALPASVWLYTASDGLTHQQSDALRTAVLVRGFSVSYNATTRTQVTTYFKADGVTTLAATTVVYDLTGRAVTRTTAFTNLP